VTYRQPMDFLRTPAEGFVGLVDFPSDATMVGVGDGLQMAVVNERTRDGRPELFLFLRRIAGAHRQPHVTIEGGSHFVQEDKPAELVRAILGS
jgi:pimeloyl-ACP methyl ester carboxylesterase